MAPPLAAYAAKGAATALGLAYVDARTGFAQDALKGRALAAATLGVKWANYRDRNSVSYVGRLSRDRGAHARADLQYLRGHSQEAAQCDLLHLRGQEDDMERRPPAYVSVPAPRVSAHLRPESRRVAYYLLEQGIKSGDIVALLMHNKPAYPILWLAMLQVRVRADARNGASRQDRSTFCPPS
jgi:hypothetical protein